MCKDSFACVCVCVCYNALIVIMSAIMCPNCVLRLHIRFTAQWASVCVCVWLCVSLLPSLNLTYLFALSTTSLLTPETHAMPSLSYPDSSLWLCAAAVAGFVAVAASVSVAVLHLADGQPTGLWWQPRCAAPDRDRRQIACPLVEN